MDWQQITALVIVAATAGLFVASRLRRRKFSFERDTHCGCSSPAQDGAKQSIIFHARRGERPVVIEKNNSKPPCADRMREILSARDRNVQS